MFIQSAKEFIDLYHEKLAETDYTINTVYQIAFDTMWTLALVLNYTEEMRLENISKFQNCI